MSVPFKYRQHIRDMHESFHDGKPISEEELMGVMDIIAPAEHQALIDQYRAKCPLNSNSFLSLMYELQKASKIPYEDLVWNYIRGTLKRGVFNGEDRTDLKTLRSTLDPLMRAVRLDVPNLYKAHAPPDGEGKITVDQLCDVFRAMYPVNQIVYLEMYKWARIKKVPKGRGSITELAKNFEAITPPSLVVPAPPVVSRSPSASKPPQPREDTPSEVLKAATNATVGDDSAETASSHQRSLRTQEKEVTNETQEELEKLSQFPEEGSNLPDRSLPTEQWKCTSETDGEVKKPEVEIQLPDVSETSLRDSTNPKVEENVETSSIKETEANIQRTPSLFSEKKVENGTVSHTSLPAATFPFSPLDPRDQPEPLEGEKDAAKNFIASERPSVSVTSLGSFPYSELPPNVQVERRPGLNFNPPYIRDMEPSVRKQNSSTDGDNKSSLPPRLRGHEEQLAWEQEEVLLDAMLSRVVPGKPIDSQVMEYLKELARQEEELESALRAEMENLTSNMLACEIVEQRMMILRAQRQAQCFDRMESRRFKLLEEMEKYLSQARKAHGQNKVLLAGIKESDMLSCRKDGHSLDHDGNTTKAREKPADSVSMFTPPPPLLSAERQRRTLKRELRLGEKLQRMQINSPRPASMRRVSLPQDPHFQIQQIPSCMEPEFLQRSPISRSLGNTSQRGCWAKKTTPRQPVPVVHSRPVQQQTQQHLSPRHFGGEDFTILVNSGAQSSQSPLPRQTPNRGVHPHLTSRMAADVLTSSQLQRKIEERLEARFSKAFQAY
ncbi:hypothetical protein MOQ_001418 [Trypanosoma cruzi marinkellei]|uniref:Uncharacterized protein n=1 Tax=Trypanosoma cruzi marinkellei TaxID=85056 RepID=K2NKU6_TRYCR|nr:hypothetical protein MOQ_001418 [Trypanosoma cruzi marinkellei]